MANATPESSRPVRRRSWTRKLAPFCVGLLLLLVALYFVATSAPFFKGVVLPRVGKALNAEFTVGNASISPFSRVVLRQLKVKTAGAEPLLQADEVRLRYSLWSIVGGNIKVDEVTLDSPTIQIVQNADGTSNLDPLLGKEEKPAAKPPTKPSKPPQLDVKNVTLKNVSLRAVQIFKDGGRQTVELSDINIGLDELKNGGSGKLTLAAAMKMERTQTNAHDLLQARGTGALEFALGPDLMPQFVRGKVTHEIVKGDGSFAGFSGERSELDCDVTPTEVKNFSVSFFQSDKPLGALRITGPFDLNKLEGHLKLEVQSIDRQVLNLAGATRGWDFDNSTLNATNLIDIAQRGSVIAANGKLTGRQLGIKQGKQSTPTLDLDFDYQVTVNLNDDFALLQKLNLLGKQGQNDLLRAVLDRPMNLTWGAVQPGFKESSLQLAINKLNLADWQLFLGNIPVSGKADAQLNLLAQQDGKKLQTDLTAKVQELNAQLGPNRIERANVQLQLTGQMDDFKNATVEKYSLAFGQGSQPTLTANGSASYTLNSGDLSAQATFEASLPALLRQVVVPQLNASAGTIKLTALALRKGQETSASGNAVLGDFSGRYDDYQFQNYQTTFDFDVGVKDQVAQLRRVALAVRQGPESGGSFDLAGKYDLAKQSGQFSFTAVDFNQNALRPFLAPALAPNKLVSLSLNGKGSANYDPQGESSVKAGLTLTNLVVEDPQNKFPKSSLAAGLQLDGGMKQSLVNLRQLLLTFSPTDRAKNQLQLSGKVDLAKTNAAPGQLTLQAESLDATPYYDLFAGPLKTRTAEPEKKTKTAPQPAASPVEPDPVALPFEQFTLDAKIDRLYLREIAVSNFLATVKLNHGEVAVKPLQLAFNGAPVGAGALANLAVKGYTYDLWLNADKVPLEPIANTFAPDDRGQYQGLILANAQIKGAGVTGTNLRTNLNGQVSYSYTNANIQLLGKKAKLLIWPIATLLRVKDITKSPVNWLDAQIQLGAGKIRVNRFALQSEAFEAHAHGDIPIADVLDQSPLNLPVEFSLRRSLAQKSGLTPPGAPPDTPYVKLPDFVTVKGTLGDPKTHLNELALGGLLLKTGVGIAEKVGVNVGDKTGGLLKGVGNLLTGQKPTTTNDTTTTNPPPKFNPLDLLRKKK